MPKIGIINLTSCREPYSSFDAIKKSYYDSRGVLYKWVYNEPETRDLLDHEMLYVSACSQESGIPVMLEKFIWALRELLDKPGWDSCDYIMRCNSSTFINLEVLESYLQALPRRRCYAGWIVNGRFISGTCIIVSRDVASYLARKAPGKEKDSLDDLVISRYMDRRLIRMRNIPMAFYDDNALHDIASIRKALDKFPLIRVKNGKDRMLYDLDIWRKIAAVKMIRALS